MTKEAPSAKDIKTTINYLVHIAKQGKLNISVDEALGVAENLKAALVLAEAIPDDPVDDSEPAVLELEDE